MVYPALPRRTRPSSAHRGGSHRGGARPERRARRSWQWAFLGSLLAIGAAAQSPSAIKQVLMLQSFDRGMLVLDHFTGDFRVVLDQRVGKPVNVVQVVVGPTGFVGAPEQAVVDYIQAI